MRSGRTQRNKEKRQTRRMRAYTAAETSHIHQKYIGIVLDSDVWILWRVLIHVSFPGAMGCLCLHQEVVTFERSQAYPEYTLDDRFA